MEHKLLNISDHCEVTLEMNEIEIYRNLQALSASYGVFNKNYNELIRFLSENFWKENPP